MPNLDIGKASKSGMQKALRIVSVALRIEKALRTWQSLTV